jgi:DnaK suppressor protein
MKTVAKKAVKKAPSKVATKTPSKVAAKVVTKAAAKKTANPVKSAPKLTEKPINKANKANKEVAKSAVKTATKQSPKAIIKQTAKLVVKVAAKPLAKPLPKVPAKVPVKVPVKTVTKVTNMPANKSVSKTQKPIETAATPDKKNTKKTNAVPVPAKQVKAVKLVKAPQKTITASKSSPSPEELNLKQPMVIASKIAPTEIKDSSSVSPAQSKARTSRLASLTVPSMAQTVASTAAKSSYGPHIPSLAIIPPPQFSPKQNPKLANNWKTKTAEEMTDAELLAMPDSEYMNIKQMNYFRLKLLQLKQGILASAGATTEHLRDESAVVPDPTDRATIEEEHALELRTRDRERKLLKKIEQSIVRIDAGDYGYCDETGEAIGVGRLLARPTATLSLEAQQRRELKQKMFGD